MADETEQVEGQQQTEEKPERPDWLPERFQTPEALADSYKELERARGEDRQELAAMREQMEQLTALQQEAREPRYDPDAQREQLLEAYEQDPVGTIAYLAQATTRAELQRFAATQQQQTAPQLEAQHEMVAYTADQLMQARHQDWEEMKPQVAELIAKRPFLLPDERLGTPAEIAECLDTAYELVSGRAAQTQLGQAQDGRLAKEQAQTLQGAGGRPLSPSDAEEHFAGLMAAAQKSYSGFRGLA